MNDGGSDVVARLRCRGALLYFPVLPPPVSFVYFLHYRRLCQPADGSIPALADSPGDHDPYAVFHPRFFHDLLRPGLFGQLAGTALSAISGYDPDAGGRLDRRNGPVSAGGVGAHL